MGKVEIKGDDRRQYVRIPARFAVMMKLDMQDFPDYTMEAEVVNISEGGVLLSMPDKRANTQGLQDESTTFFYGDLKFESLMSWLQFTLPTTHQPIRVLGKSAWVKQPNGKSKQCLVAMQFTHISTEDRMNLSRFIQFANSSAS